MYFVTEWTTGQDKESRAAVEAVKRAEQALARARRRGVKAPEAEALAKEAREALNIVARARSVHNPPAAEALRRLAQQKAHEVTARLGETGTSTRPAERPK